MEKFEKLIDINKKKGLPRKYRFNQFIRWFALIFGIAAIVYAIWVIVYRLDSDSSTLFVIIPILILVFAGNTVIKNLINVNTVIFNNDTIVFKYIAKKSVTVPWERIKKMHIDKNRRRHFVIVYDQNLEEKHLYFPLGFPDILEIVNSIYEMCPDIELDDFMSKVIISPKERAKAKLQKNTSEYEDD